jgi:molecular chaperone DnaJ
MTTRESYRILGVKAQAGWEEIRSRFRALAQKLHPDKNPGNPEAAAQFRRLVQAVETIREHRRRAPQGEKRWYRTPPSPQDDFFEEIFGLKPEAQAGGREAGPDFRYDLSISLVDALLGKTITLNVPHLIPCSHCDGSGGLPARPAPVCPDCQGQGRRPLGPGMLRRGTVCRTCQGRGVLPPTPCPLCQGRGQRLNLKQHRLQIPPGTADGARLRLAGQGGEGFGGGPRGNLEIVIFVEPHEFFSRRGNDLHCRVEVSFAQAALGGKVRVPTLRGYQTIDLPRGTQNGRVFRLPGAGAPGNPLSPAGDQIVEVVVTTPSHLSPAQRDILEELARLGKEGLGMAAHE